MLSPLSGGILLLVTSAAFTACPFYRLTLRGLLAGHWVLINYVESATEFSQSSTFFLLPLASLFVLAEAIAFPGRGESELTPFFSTLTCFIIASADVLVVILTLIARLETGLILLSSLLALLFIVVTTETQAVSPKEQGLLNSADLTVNSVRPIDAFGAIPILHLAAIALDTVVQIPLIASPPRLLLSSIYIIRSIATLSMLFTPANFGGFVQAMKRTGRALGSRFAQPDNAAAYVEGASE